MYDDLILALMGKDFVDSEAEAHSIAKEMISDARVLQSKGYHFGDCKRLLEQYDLGVEHLGVFA